MKENITKFRAIIAGTILLALAGGPVRAADTWLKAPVWKADVMPMFGDLGDFGPSVLAPAKYGAFKIAENESPTPQDRVFLAYNYFNNVRLEFGPGVDVHRAVIGIEKTFLDGNASFGLRLPFMDINDPHNQLGQNLSQSGLGDISAVFKYAFINTPNTTLSAGLVVTLPTGNLPNRFDFHLHKEIHSTLIQPFVGGLWNQGNFFVQGFSSIVVPTDSRDFTLWFNSIGVGYWAYRAPATELLSGIVPMVELHNTVPLKHREGSTPEVFPDVLNLTVGSRVQFYGQHTLGIAVSLPLSSPKPFAVEALASFNLRY